MTRAVLAAAVIAGCSSSMGESKVAGWISDTSSFGPGTGPASLADRYGATAARIIAAARADHGAYDKLSELTDQIGHRLSGSPELDRAIDWATRTMAADGHAVHTEKVMVPHWERGPESAALVAPIARPLSLLALGGSVATPKGGITAPVVVVHDFAELEAKASAVRGAIVLYDVAMPAWTEENGPGYGDTVQYRTRGPSRAAKLGAVAALVRSVTAHSLHTPHTGALSYDPAQRQIPAAALTVEDSALIARLARRGPVTVSLRLESRMLPDAPSANVIGELRGRERPDEVVVIGAHLDSWDVGQGAHDDGAGCVTMMEALTVLRKLGLTPRRTIRVVLFTNEENGLAGGKAYAAQHTSELPAMVAAIESDSGGFAPRGFSVDTKPDVSARVTARLTELAALVSSLGVRRITAGHAGSDISPLVPGGVPAIGLETDSRSYFDIHHTEADTLDKVNPAELADDVAAVAVIAYVLAEQAGRLDVP